jgi:hypothetical protein
MAFSFLRRLFAQTPPPSVPDPSAVVPEIILHDEEDERLLQDLQSIEDPTRGERMQMEADREIRTATELSLKRLHVLQRGRCPQCGDSLRQHLFASVCNTCGWNSYAMPRQGSVCVHLAREGQCIEGDRCYTLKDGVTIVLKGEAVIARVAPRALGWIEYKWNDAELTSRKKQINERLVVPCGWCGKETHSEQDGFHMAQVAFGATQERYCFCSDECYTSFREMYPARVHRNCYERSCATCNLCIKRYRDEAEGIRTLAKDLLRAKPGI